MSSPRALVQIFVTGSKILGKAFYEAGRQAVKNAKQGPQGAIGDVGGVGNATSGSPTDQVTRQHKMTLDEAQLILNIKHGDDMEKMSRHYEHLFTTNSPPPPPEKPISAKNPIQFHSHYIRSKVFCARERIEAELKAEVASNTVKPAPDSPQPPHQSPTSGAT